MASPGTGGKTRPGFAHGISRVQRAVEASVQEAIDLLVQGKVDEAARLLEKALAARPDHFPALSQLGALRFRQGRLEESLRCFMRAAKSMPGEAAAWSNAAVVNWNMGRAQETLECADKALALWPDYPDALNSRGNALRSLGRRDQAVECYERALRLRPDSIEALLNLGRVLQDLRLFDKALSVRDKALELQPQNAGIHGDRAAVLIELDRPAEALASAERALALDPRNLQAANNRGVALKLLKRPLEALAAYDAALALDPSNEQLWRNRAGALADLNRPQEALDCLDRAIALNPGGAAGHEGKAMLLGELGRSEEALASIRQAIRLAPDCARLLYNLTQLQRLSADDPAVDAMNRLAGKIGSLDVNERIFLHYALAKVHEDGGEDIKAFQSQCAGAALKRGQVHYDEARVLGVMQRTIEVFDAALFEAMKGRGDAAHAPVFIVGMPRSGSTLVEQILASHPGVAGLGETDAFFKAMSDFDGPGACALNFPDSVPRLTEAQLRRIGESYARRTKELAPDARLIVDKLLDNFRLLGLIHLALPKARFIHIARDPIAACLSSFSKWYADGVDYSYDLGELGRYHRGHDRLMAHWRRMLPQGVILDMRYEEIVSDFEAQTRRLAAFCGLEWDPRCVDFHRTERQVRTASKMQVRQPLSSASVGRGKTLDAFLAPLKAGLGLTGDI